MKTLIFGGSGQVGTELKKLVQLNGDVRVVERREADFSRPQTIEKLVDEVKPTRIINAAAYTSVDQAEVEEDLVHQINATAVNALASCAKKYDALLVHYSTDYVFDGAGERPYKEVDKTNPETVYGQSKLKGEAYIQSSGCRYVILRTTWVISATGKNFLKTIMRHALTKDSLQVVNDQIGAVTCAGLIAQVTDDLIRKDAVAQIDSGIYHLCSSGEGSWFDVAVYAIKRASERGVLLRCDASNVQPVSSDQYPVRANRPKSSKLSTEKLQRILTNPLPHWKMCVDVTIDELLMKDFFK